MVHYFFHTCRACLVVCLLVDYIHSCLIQNDYSCGGKQYTAAVAWGGSCLVHTAMNGQVHSSSLNNRSAIGSVPAPLDLHILYSPKYVPGTTEYRILYRTPNTEYRSAYQVEALSDDFKLANQLGVPHHMQGAQSSSRFTPPHRSHIFNTAERSLDSAHPSQFST